MSPRIVIVGGVAGGMSAATRARRMNEFASITVLERGGFISFANCGLPYYLAGRIASEDRLLLATPEKVRARFNIDARVRSEVLRIDRDRKHVEVRDLNADEVYTLPYDKLILAPGASPIVPPIEHIRAPNVFVLRSMEDARAAHRYLADHKPRIAVVVGAGFIGLEVAEALHERGADVMLVEKAPHVLPPIDTEMAAFVTDELANHKIRVITGIGLKSLHAQNGIVTAVEIENGDRLPADLVLLSIGVRPNTRLAADAGLNVGPSGGIAVDAFQRTSDPEIYAVGDAAEITHGVTGQPARVPLAGPANRQGRLAGEHAATGSAQPAGPILGTAIVGVFDLAIAMAGLSEEAARRAGLDFDTAYALPSHHAGYYPGAKQMRIKLVYEKPTGRILGSQIVGREGVDKRIDVIATAMHFKGTIDDLAALDLAYAPQYGSAKDPVHIVAMVAQNQRRDFTPATTTPDSPQLVDVRTSEEFASGTIRGAVNIPLDSLRHRLNELDTAAPTVAFCQVGQRGHVATRILRQRGFHNARNLKGGIALARRGGVT